MFLGGILVHYCLSCSSRSLTVYKDVIISKGGGRRLASIGRRRALTDGNRGRGRGGGRGDWRAGGGLSVKTHVLTRC